MYRPNGEHKPFGLSSRINIPIRLHKQSNNNRYELLMTHYALIYGSDRTMVIL